MHPRSIPHSVANPPPAPCQPDGKAFYTGDLSGEVSRYDPTTIVLGAPKREWRYTIDANSVTCEREDGGVRMAALRMSRGAP